MRGVEPGIETAGEKEGRERRDGVRVRRETEEKVQKDREQPRESR